MDSKIRWQFNPFDKVQPLRQHQNLPRSQSLNEIREQPVRIMCYFKCYIQTSILAFIVWSTTFGSCLPECSVSYRT
jgi:hypothetical protein